MDSLVDWTREGHILYVIREESRAVGFLHVNKRGDTVYWIEDIYVDAPYRGRGIASTAIGMAERMLYEQGVGSVCMDVVPDNLQALKLYRRLGYDRLSIVTVRKDFEEFETARIEKIGGMEFRVKKF